MWHVTASVYPVLAAQTLSPDPGDEDPNVPGGQLGQLLVAQLGDDVEADYALVPLVGAGLRSGRTTSSSQYVRYFPTVQFSAATGMP